ncbi:MAG: hypothetical protein HYZ10_08420 [Ignavibacteriales bacterium]|nr:hypothetical protein [Ignavibacteriales bacterium]
MFKSLMYKEWLKIKWIVVGLALINVLVILNIYLDLSNTFKELAANSVVGQFQAYEIVFYYDIKNIILVTGLLLGVFQFFPEISQSRLKLTFHLPVKENKLMLQMTSVGVFILLLIFIIDAFLLSIVCIKLLPKEFFDSMLMTTLPWYVGSIVTYCWVIIIFVEPNWTKRIISIFLALGIISLFYAGSGFSAYSNSIFYFVLLAVFCSTIIFLSAYNFKRGIC